MEKLKQQILSYYKDITFDEKNHKYFANGKKIKISVSGITHKFVENFDTKGISQKVAINRGISQSEVLKEWEHAKTIACDLGNNTHLFGEIYCFDRSKKPKSKFEEAIVKFWNDLPEHIIPVFVELKMYHKRFLFAGTADIILYNTITKKFIIADYKTNKALFKNYKGKRMLYPFNFLLDTNYNKYQLQLSLYQILLEQILGIEVEARVIVWLRPTGDYEMYKTTDYTKELLNYLEHNKL